MALNLSSFPHDNHYLGEKDFEKHGSALPESLTPSRTGHIAQILLSSELTSVGNSIGTFKENSAVTPFKHTETRVPEEK
jgi:hypothetical protein